MDQRCRALRRVALAAALTLAAAGAPVLAGTGPAPVPVTIGDEPDLDACPSVAMVSGLRPGGDGFLAVRDGPGTGHAQVDSFHEGREFFVCTSSKDGTWFGIVYAPEDAPGTDCGVGSPVPVRRDYTGPCRSGWVHSRWVVVVAG